MSEIDAVVVNEAEFYGLLASRCRTLLGAAAYLARQPLDEIILSQPLLSQLWAEAAQIEELLDYYGARGNRRWHRFRNTIAAFRRFAQVAFKLLHIRHAAPAYRLLPVDGDFKSDTENALRFSSNTFLLICSRLLPLANEAGLVLPPPAQPDPALLQPLPGGRLPRDRGARRIGAAAATVAQVATAFLNLVVESDLLQIAARISAAEYAALIPEPVSEENIRQLEFKFHNLQSLYDTFVSDTDLETIDPSLLTLYGHISVIFHLLGTATDFVHHYERHLMLASGESACLQRQWLAKDELLTILMSYNLRYAQRYLEAGRSLCQAMLRRYAKLGRIMVPFPRYHGFHVRPSTLVARIVHHYGSEVRMELDGELYDASSPLDLFRANEKINAVKRRHLAAALAEKLASLDTAQLDAADATQKALAELHRQNAIIIYEPFTIARQGKHLQGAELLAYALEEASRLFLAGKLDVPIECQVAFLGDERVLADLRALAESGYGEDENGNNVPLPKSLSYLR